MCIDSSLVTTLQYVLKLHLFRWRDEETEFILIFFFLLSLCKRTISVVAFTVI